jgi:peptidoglycan/xylan/chitin deacetylase (PgdA/CDA1 family)
VDRPPLRWPNGARVAVWVIPNVEHFRFDSTFPGSPDPGASPDIPGYSIRDFGNRVGIWRVMEVLDRFGIRGTVALNAEVCDYEPQIIRAGNERKWEWMGHGVSNSVRVTRLTEDEERAHIHDTLQRIEAGTGTRPVGWLGPGLGETVRTPDLLREAGVEYVADWVNDDQPYAMTTAAGPLYSIPYSSTLNDKRIFEGRGETGSEWRTIIVDQFDTLYREGEHSGRVMAISLHPYLTGAGHRIKYLAEGLEYVAGHEHVWWATGSEIVAAYRAQAEA